MAVLPGTTLSRWLSAPIQQMSAKEAESFLCAGLIELFMQPRCKLKVMSFRTLRCLKNVLFCLKSTRFLLRTASSNCIPCDDQYS